MISRPAIAPSSLQIWWKVEEGWVPTSQLRQPSKTYGPRSQAVHNPPGIGVHFQDLRPVAVHLQVAAAGQPGDAAPDDDDLVAGGSGRRRSRRMTVSARNAHPWRTFPLEVRGDVGNQIERGRHLLAREPAAAKREDVLGGCRGAAVAQLHFGVDGLAQLRVRPGGHARTQHRRVLVQHGGDFLRKHLVAGHVNHGLQPSVNDDPPGVVAMRQVAGQEPAVAQNFLAPFFGVQIAGKHSGTAQGKLSGLAGREGFHLLVQDGRVVSRAADGPPPRDVPRRPRDS